MKFEMIWGGKDDEIKEHMVKPQLASSFGPDAYVYSEMQARVLVILALDSAPDRQKHE